MMETNDPDDPIQEIEDIDEIIADELRKDKDGPPMKPSDEAKRQKEASAKIAKAILDLIKSGELKFFLSYTQSQMLASMIRRAKLNNYMAHSTFRHIEIVLRELLGKQPEGSSETNYLESTINMINSTAVRYFEQYLVDEFKDVHVAEILQRSKATLARLDERDEKYFMQAIESIKKNAERHIELRKEEKLNRDQMYEPDEEREDTFSLVEQEKPDDRMKRQKERGLTRESAYLVFDYLLNHAIKDGNINPQIKARAEVVEFLSGYSWGKLKDVPAWFRKQSAKSKEDQDTEENFFPCLEIVRKQFEQLGLQEIVDQIDDDLGV